MKRPAAYTACALIAATAAATLPFQASSAFAAEAAETAPQNRMLTAEQVTADVMLARHAYERIHPGYARYATSEEMDAAWDAVIAKGEGGMTVGALYLAISRALTTIRCDHTKANLPKDLRDARAGQPLYLPFRWSWLEGRGIVIAPAQGNALSAGDEILTIDGRPLAEMVSEVAPLIPVDGYTEWSRRGAISESLEHMGGAVDHFGALMWDVPAEAVLRVQSADGTERMVTVRRTDFEGWSALGETSGANFKDAIRFETIGENAAYLAIDTFVNYRNPVDPDTLLAPIFAQLAAEGRDTLILDLRKNGGGSNDASTSLFAHLIAEPAQRKTDMRVATLDIAEFRRYLSTWDPRALDPDPRGFIANDDGTYSLRPGITDDTAVVEPAEDAFNGRLIILTSDANSSGSTNLMAVLQGQRPVTLIGEKTGGSAEGPTAGLMFTLTLPESGITTRLPIFLQPNNVSGFERGMGLTPDIAVPMTVKALRSGDDPAMEAALELAARPANIATNSAETTTAITDLTPLTLADFAPAMGEGWTGTLSYTDYGSGKLTAIPTKLELRPKGKRTIQYGIVYPGEESANDFDSWRISRDGSSFARMPVISRSASGETPLRFVTRGAGEDDGKPATIRMSYELGETAIIIRKEVLFEDSADWMTRNEYRYTR